MTDIPAPTTPPAAPGLDDRAPVFEARTTQGPVRLSDFRGEWLMLFAHPADFTPVCTSEFVALERARADFEAEGCALLGLSVDSVFAHLAWIKDIERQFGLTISFPIVEDISMAISRAYGMIHERSSTTATVRSVYFIDPEGMIRAMLHYPLTIGRSVDELLRVLRALKANRETGLSLPANWTPGAPGLEPPPTTVTEATGAPGSWYIRERDVPR